jgi:hypothetical protein
MFRNFSSSVTARKIINNKQKPIMLVSEYGELLNLKPMTKLKHT